MNPEIKAQWVAALRSGEYKKIEGRLGTPSGNCANGVLCERAVSAGVATRRDGEFVYEYDGRIALMPVSVLEWAGLTVSEAYDVADMNDAGDEDAGWGEVVDWIEEHL